MIPSKFPFIANEFNGKRALVTGGTAGIGKILLVNLTLLLEWGIFLDLTIQNSTT